jgi:anti-anti-sigma factor
MPDLDFDLVVAPGADGSTRLTLRGELDLGSVPRLEAAIAATRGAVLLDLRALTFMDSTGVRVLLEAAQRGQVGIVAPATGDVRTTIDETGIGPLLPLVDPPAEDPA